MKLMSKIPLEGILTISKRFLNGKEEVIFYEKNLITLARKQFILSGVYISSVVSDPVNALKVGTGGTVDPEGLFPKTEDPTWTNLNTPLLSVATTYILDNTVPKVTFLADIDTGTANGYLINEAALFTVANLMFNVKCFPAVPKSSEFSLHFEWIIKFA